MTEVFAAFFLGFFAGAFLMILFLALTGDI
jgi:hypothetical protein